jgi:hypothetical protein
VISDRDTKKLLKLAREATRLLRTPGELELAQSELRGLVNAIDWKEAIAQSRKQARRRRYLQKYGVKEGLRRWRQATQDVKMPRRKK